ncbi:MAG: aminotransferase class V-fold PLP-dependent enzyme, partial [Bacteroidetes bacterium]|nr:aminotransferase class V-fold PLP-dependent enzyme [Bacteroidota bacterium]
MKYQHDLSFAKKLDSEDPLKKYRSDFFIPEENGKPVHYFCGNSLGLQPKSVAQYINQEIEDWKNLGVEGHFKAKNPWFPYHEFLTEKSAKIVGALNHEIVVMNTLTVNLHLMMTTFYRPTKKRFKIIIEGGAFPSDIYAVQSQAQLHSFKIKDAIIELWPRKGENNLRTEDIVKQIKTHEKDLAMVMLGGVNYYTGQAFDMKTITKAAHQAGAIAGFDLAHAAGNLL